MYPQCHIGKRSLTVVAAAAVLLLPACGGGKSKTVAAGKRVTAAGFSVAFPEGWTLERGARSLTAKRDNGPELASATVLALRRRYTPSLFARAVGELDRRSEALATQLGGEVIARRSIVVAGIRSRQYDLAHEQAGSGLVDQITYVLRGRLEYYLFCRRPADEGPSAACALLTASFRIR